MKVGLQQWSVPVMESDYNHITTDSVEKIPNQRFSSNGLMECKQRGKS